MLRRCLLPLLLILSACQGGDGDGEVNAPTTAAATSTSASSVPPVTTAVATTTTIDPFGVLALGCFDAMLDDATIAYVNDIESQLVIPSGVADSLYAVGRNCRALADEMLSNGDLEASSPVTTVADIADEYAVCLVAPDYQCGVLRMNYITAVNIIGGCPVASSIFDLAIDSGCAQLLQGTADALRASIPVDVVPATTGTVAPAVVADLVSASGILESLSQAGLPIAGRVVYDEDNDPNDLLGRPGNYIGKAAWADERIAGECVDGEIGWECGGDIEFFADSDAQQARFDYLSGFANGNVVGGYYLWKAGGAVVRIGYALSPSQAEEYAAVLRRLFGSVEQFG